MTYEEEKRIAELEEAFLLHVALVADTQIDGDRDAAQERLDELVGRMKARLQ